MEGGRYISVTHKLQLTMIDGKVCNALILTLSSRKCYVCGATPTEMNKLDVSTRKEVDVTVYELGLSMLHAWIRFFECLLHISYRMEVKKWQIRKQDHEKVQQRKHLIQEKFRKEMSLLVDVPKPGGSGTTNDGNTARRFFRDPTLSASITGIDKTLIRKCSVTLQALSSGYRVNVTAFDNYAKETAKLFVSLYAWYYMPASVYKVLIHGSVIVSAALLPISQLSEEAQEARNKDIL